MIANTCLVWQDLDIEVHQELVGDMVWYAPFPNDCGAKPEMPNIHFCKARTHQSGSALFSTKRQRPGEEGGGKWGEGGGAIEQSEKALTVHAEWYRSRGSLPRYLTVSVVFNA